MSRYSSLSRPWQQEHRSRIDRLEIEYTIRHYRRRRLNIEMANGKRTTGKTCRPQSRKTSRRVGQRRRPTFPVSHFSFYLLFFFIARIKESGTGRYTSDTRRVAGDFFCFVFFFSKRSINMSANMRGIE